MSRPERLTRLSLGVALAIAITGAAAAQAPVPKPAPQEPVPVAENAPKGSSGDVAMGAALGVVGGLLVLLLIVGSGG